MSITAEAPPVVADGAGLGSAEAAIRAFWPRVAGTTVTRVTLMALYIAASIITARALGPQGLGALTVMLTLGALGVQLGHLGLPSAVAYLVARDRTRLDQLIGGALACSVGAGSLIAAALLALFVAMPSLAPLSSAPLLAAAVAWLPFGLLALLLLNLLLGLERMHAYNGIQVAQSAIGCALVVLIAATGNATVGGMYAASFVPLVLTCAVLLALVRRDAPAGIRLPDAALVKSAAGYGFRAYLALLFGYTVLRFDLLMVARMVGHTDAGHYAVAASGGELITLPFAALGTVLFGAVAGSGVRWEFVRRVTAISAAALIPVVLLAAVCAAPAVRIVLGVAYAPAVPAFLWLLPGLYFMGINTILMHYFAATGMPLIAVMAPAAASALNIALNLVLLPRLGITGAALSSTVAYGSMLLCSLVYLGRLRLRFSALRSAKDVQD